MVVCVCMNCKQETNENNVYISTCVCMYRKQATSKIKQQSHKKIGHTTKKNRHEKNNRRGHPKKTKDVNVSTRRLYIYIYIYIQRREKRQK